MTTLTYSKQDVDLVARWLAARDNEKKHIKTYHGTRPNVPADIMMKLCERIWRRFHGC